MSAESDAILYSFRRCPFAMRARLAIDIAQQRCELREVVLAAKPAALLAASPKGTVPVWVDPRAGVIDQSLDIMRHVLTQGGCVNYLPSSDPDHVTHDWVQTCDGAFKHHLDHYKYASRYAEPASTSLHHRACAAAFIETLDAHLRTSGHLAGDVQGWPDLAIAPFIRQFRLADAQWFDQQPWPGVHAWLGRFLADPRFVRIMQKFPVWCEGEAGIAFPLEDIATASQPSPRRTCLAGGHD